MRRSRIGRAPDRDATWNHNTAYHREILAAVPDHRSAVLDVGCGDGLLLARLAQRAGYVTGIDPDPVAAAAARGRLAGRPQAQVLCGDVLGTPDLDGRQFDLISCVATLHHLPLSAGLARLRALLAPGGRLIVVGLSAPRSATDWAVSGALALPVRAMSRWHGESIDPGMRTARPTESLAQIRRAARAELPGSRVRRRFYYRYTLTWTRPPAR